jgi:hypothetical protein
MKRRRLRAPIAPGSRGPVCVCPSCVAARPERAAALDEERRLLRVAFHVREARPEEPPAETLDEVLGEALGTTSPGRTPTW